MTRRPTSVRPDTSLETTVELMLQRELSGLPVVNDAGELVGMVSKTDLIRDGAGDDTGHTFSTPGSFEVATRSVFDVMTQKVLTVSEQASLAEAATFLIQHALHRAPVVSSTGQLVGIVSTTDIVRWVAGLP
jgi:CBS domain-containing protein